MGVEIAAKADFSLVGDELGRDVRSSLEEGLRAGVAMKWTGSPLALFRNHLGECIRAVEGHPRGEQLQRFLRIGPYFDGGEIPADKASQFLTDEETAAAISFIYSSVIWSFQGCLAELLAIGPTVRLLRRLRDTGHVPRDACLYVGDTVKASLLKSSAHAKGADLHLLGRKGTTLYGVGEVKSYSRPRHEILAQIKAHLLRASRGLTVCGLKCRPVRLSENPLRVVVLPARWRLPRAFRLDDNGLRIELATPPWPDDEVRSLGRNRWVIRLRWSQEALASAAYEMTFWYMGKVGEAAFRDGVPKEWAPMTPEEAGRNAAKMMLYYAILRASWEYERACWKYKRARSEYTRMRWENERTRWEYDQQAAIALYNAYGFTYALGSSFRHASGRREMLWFEDLRDILATGVTKGGCRIRGWRPGGTP